MNSNIGFELFADTESFLTDLSDLESQYVRGGTAETPGPDETPPPTPDETPGTT
ncbi:MAG: hypothetical protein QNJ54_36690 [Prochloraceae cyanobacterium]|nr:hypothetical protein [Prochloraceae cyanobacterium]